LRVYLGQIFSVPHDRNGSSAAIAMMTGLGRVSAG